VKSLWTRSPGDWQGHAVFGDNHVEFLTSNHGLTTRYASKPQQGDNLFARQAAPGITEGASDIDANAFLTQD